MNNKFVIYGVGVIAGSCVTWLLCKIKELQDEKEIAMELGKLQGYMDVLSRMTNEK